MAKLKGVVSCAMMDQLAGRLRGGLDFYFWKGIPCVRIWPYGAERVQSFARAASAAAFALIAEQKAALPAIIRQSLAWLAAGSTWTWGDLFTHYAMDYYKSIGDIPPAITDIVYTTGSGLVTLAFTLDRHVAPSLQTFRRGQAKIIYKNYRGAAEKCIEPDPIFDDFPLPVPLVVTGTVSIFGSSPYYNKSSLYIRPDIPTCGAFVSAMVAAWDPIPDYSPAYGAASYSLSASRYDGGWAGSIGATRLYHSYTVPSGVGPSPDSMNGIRFTLAKNRGPLWVDGLFYGSVLGVAFSESVSETSSIVKTVGASFRAGQVCITDISNDGYFNAFPLPVCPPPEPPTSIGATVSVSNLVITLGPKGRYAYTFPTPEDRPVMLGFGGGSEKFFPMFAIYPGGVA